MSDESHRGATNGSTESGQRLRRRDVLKTTGAVAALGIGAATASQRTTASQGEWEPVESPTEQTINDVVYTADGPYAVGEGGLVLSHDENEGGWVIVIESGPAADNNPLHTVDVTDDGERIYFAGGSGAVGAYDVLEHLKHDYSAPTVEGDPDSEEEEDDSDKTSTWEGIAVTGAKDEEYVLVANGSGEVLDGHRDEDACMEWGEVEEPAGGSTIPELHYADDEAELVYGVDTSQEAFESESYGGGEWTDIGVEGAQEGFYDIVGDSDMVFVAADGGLVYRFDCDCGNWTPVDVGDSALRAITRNDEDEVLVVGSEGAIHERSDRWRDVAPDIDYDLLGVAYGDDSFETVDEAFDVAVGQGGVIVQR